MRATEATAQALGCLGKFRESARALHEATGQPVRRGKVPAGSPLVDVLRAAGLERCLRVPQALEGEIVPEKPVFEVIFPVLALDLGQKWPF